ncbi:olfactory receptor 4C11-like protein [Camelus ferus]|nr:olfactory receptor 4C11-like protein [Camelus ferus]
MYFFLFYLSLADSCFSTSTAPRLIVDALSTKKIISYSECMTQVFALHFFGCMEVFVLILMAVDRYVAICKPLHYPTIMSRQVCIILITLAWIGSFMHSMAQIIPALRLPFCGPNLIDRYCCDLQPLLKLACMDTYAINLLWVTNSGAICSSSFVILMTSYILILHSLQNPTPRVIADALLKNITISFSECIVQVFSFHSFGCLEIFILILMAIDHYVAIYTYVTNLLLVSNSGAICTVSFVVLMVSYVVILHHLRNHSAEGRRKALSTCISHIIVVILFFGPYIFIYTRPATTFPMDKMITVFYTIGTPLINPLIYTLRNAEVKNAMRMLWRKNVISDDKR